MNEAIYHLIDFIRLFKNQDYVHIYKTAVYYISVEE